MRRAEQLPAHLDRHEPAIRLLALGVGDGVRAVNGLDGDLAQVLGHGLERAGGDLVRREVQQQDLVDRRRLEPRSALCSVSKRSDGSSSIAVRVSGLALRSARLAGEHANL